VQARRQLHHRADRACFNPLRVPPRDIAPRQ
jgi:hypothetical protein